MTVPDELAERHRAAAAGFAAVVGQVSDWGGPTPVPEWRARDVVSHLVDWSTGFLAGGGVPLPPAGVDVTAEPAAAWSEHSAAVQVLFDDPDAAFDHPMVGRLPVGEAVDRFYTTDVLMHTWDLARAAGVDPGVDEQWCADILVGMLPVDEMLRSSGHYGPKQPVADDAPASERLMAFVGRDPHWTPPGS